MPQTRHFLIATTLALLAVGCATAPPPVAVSTPQFTYAYPAVGEVPASDVTIAIVRPLDAKGLTKATSIGHQNAEAFTAAMTAQVQEMFNKKGFKQSGPFDNLNFMTFPDKKGAVFSSSEVSMSICKIQKLRRRTRQAIPG